MAIVGERAVGDVQQRDCSLPHPKRAPSPFGP
jgi:hypothetical protein